MKRIVREVIPLKQGDIVYINDIEENKVYPGVIIDFDENLIDIRFNFIRHVFHSNGNSAAGNRRLQALGLDQTTFEQAFAEWDSKPFSYINHDTKKVYWVMPCEDENLIITNWGDVFTDEWCNLKELIKDFKIFQSESWEAFYEQDLPQLIRMARGE